jgi:hypothetical protein
MFAIKSLSKYLFGDASKANIVDLPQGQLYLVRPRSVKGHSELIFRDSAAFIRRTATEFTYQIVVQRAYEEGEAELIGEEEDGGVSDKDERVFLLDEHLRLRIDLRESGETVVKWRDLSGEEGDSFEFVCGEETRPESAASFELVAAQCQFERKYRRAHTEATDEDLREFEFEDELEGDFSEESLTPSPSLGSPEISPAAPTTRFIESPDTPIRSAESTMVRNSKKKDETSLEAVVPTPTKAPLSRTAPETREVLASEQAQVSKGGCNFIRSSYVTD